MSLYLKEYQKYDRSKLKVQLLLSKFRLFNFDLLHFWLPLRYRVTQYLIRKFSDMVKMGQEGLVVAALLVSVKSSWKLKIYYINRAMSKLNCYTLYTNDFEMTCAMEPTLANKWDKINYKILEPVLTLAQPKNAYGGFWF